MSFFKKRVDHADTGFGCSLRGLREVRGYSLEQLSRLTGIHTAIIRLLEEDRVEALSDPQYAVRHVQSLVRALEGRTRYFIDKYENLLQERHLLHQRDTLLPKRVLRRELFVASRVITMLGCVVFALAIAGYVLWQATVIAAAPHLTVRVPIDGALAENPSVLVSGKTDSGAQVSVNDARAVVEADGSFYSRVSVPRGLSTIRIEARRRYGSSIIIERHVAYPGPSSTSTSL